MNDLLFGGGLLFSLILGTAAISIAYGLQKRRRIASLSSYLYFQVFITVFGVYGLIGQLIARKILEQRGGTYQTIETIGHFFGFLGFPFLILAWFMFLRLCWEMSQKTLPRRVVLSYFLLLVMLFLGYGAVILFTNLSPFTDRQYAALSKVQTYVYAGIEVAVLAAGLSRLFRGARDREDPEERRGVRYFGLLWLFSYSSALALFLSSRRSGFSALVSIIAFSAANLLPLLYWRAHLKKHPDVPLPRPFPSQDLSRFLADFKISKREEEVIRELCAGKSNKEIAQTLFISIQTVKDHIYRVYQKTDVRNRVQLINLVQSYRRED